MAPWLSQVLAVVLVVTSCVAEKEECSNSRHSLVPSLLEAVGFSSSCINAALVSCALDANQVTPVLQEVRATVEDLRRDLQSKMGQSRPRHCRDLLDSGDTGAGKRQVFPFVKHPDASITVYCDHTVDGGGWTVFQRRRNLTHREDFYRTWVEYRLGFGHMEGEFWLGLDSLHQLTSTILQELRVDLKDFEGEHRWAKYGRFYVGPLETQYRLSVGRYNGTAGDSLVNRHDGSKFTTHDAANEEVLVKCAQRYRGAWWYGIRHCHYSNLNGYQHQGHHDSFADGINWFHWKEHHYSLMETTMMIRPAF